MVKLVKGKTKLTAISDNNLVKGIISKKSIGKVKSFRLSDEDIQNLSLIREEVNQYSKGTISESKIIKALICMGSKIDAQKIIKILASNL